MGGLLFRSVGYIYLPIMRLASNIPMSSDADRVFARLLALEQLLMCLGSFPAGAWCLLSSKHKSWLRHCSLFCDRKIDVPNRLPLGYMYIYFFSFLIAQISAEAGQLGNRATAADLCNLYSAFGFKGQFADPRWTMLDSNGCKAASS